MVTKLNLASRWERLIAQIIDGVLAIVPMMLFMNENIANQFGKAIGIGSIGILILVQLILLTQNGQTIGKKILKIKIIGSKTGTNGGFVPNVLLRLVLNSIIGMIPFYGLVDALFIFRGDRRCIHDFIASTVVVKA